MTLQRIAVLGAGAWGCALANVASLAGRHVTLWTRDSSAAVAMAQTRAIARLPEATLAPTIAVTADLTAAMQADAILIAVPAQALREVAYAIDTGLTSGTPMVACAKGIERGSHRFMTEVIAEAAQTALPAILSGPSFAHDVARGLPTAVTIAARDPGLAERLAHALGTATFRLYHTTDVRGVEIGGAAKNVLAIAAGIVAGRKLGASALAALVTRGFAELMRFGEAHGARRETLTGLSGMGDTILTCSSPQSRNYAYGVAIGSGMTPGEAAHGRRVDGAFTASVLIELAQRRGVDMPIAEAVAAVLDGRQTVDAAIETLLARPVGEE